MNWKNLDLDKKMKVIEFTKENPTMSCRKIGEHFYFGKTAIENILKNATTLEKD